MSARHTYSGEWHGAISARLGPVDVTGSTRALCSTSSAGH